MQYSILWIININEKNTDVQENVQIGCTGYVHIAAVLSLPFRSDI